MKCPKCGSDQCKRTTRLKTHSNSFNWANGCCGGIFLGPLGILCGLCGTGTTIKEKNIWECTQCGARFTNLEGSVYDVMDSDGIGEGIYKIFEKLGPFAVIIVIIFLVMLMSLFN